MKVRVTTSNTTTAASIEANRVRGDRVIASEGIKSIETGNGLSGGPITFTGTISANSANLTQAGIVQLNDSISSSSNTQAATPSAVNLVGIIGTSAYDQANAGYNQANNAYTQANLAYNSSNTKLNITGGVVTGDLTVTGNLLITGNTTTLNVETLAIEDNQIILNLGQSGSPSLNAEIVAARGDSTNVYIRWDEISNEWGYTDIDGNFYKFNVALTTAIAGYNKANSAYDQANAAYVQANNAYDAANLRVLKSGDTMTGNLNVDATIYSQNIIPQLDSIYNLGSIDAKFKDLYIGGDSIYIGNSSIKSTDDEIKANTFNAAVAFVSAGINVLDQANTARNTANSAYSQANTARDQANSAYNQANTALGVAGNAYDQANTANSTAGIALIRSSDAYNQANAARDQANNAYSAANLAHTAANVSANTVSISVNNTSTLYNKSLNFINTETTVITVSSDGSNANIAITAISAALNDTFSGAGNTSAVSTANIANGLYAISTNAYAQANAAYDEANSKLNLTGGTITGTLNIAGNLIIIGNTTYQNVSTYAVEDSLIYLAANNNTSDLLDIGFLGAHNTAGIYQQSGLARDADDGTWYLFTGLADEGHENNIVDFANTTYATLRANIQGQSILLGANLVATQANLTIAYNQANTAYLAANAAANTVRISQNGSSTINSANGINFVNTSAITIDVQSGLDGNANVVFSTTNAFSAKYPTDGIANSYTLPQAVSNDNNILVTIDGVAITPTDDYIVSGTTLTLTFMPPSDLNIEARSLR